MQPTLSYLSQLIKKKEIVGGGSSGNKIDRVFEI